MANLSSLIGPGNLLTTTNEASVSGKTLVNPKLQLAGSYGEANQVLVAQGANQPPIWGTVAGGDPTNVVDLAASNTIDLSQGLYFQKTVSSSTVFTITNIPQNRVVVFTVEVTHVSGAITWPNTVKFPYSNYIIPLTTGRVHLFNFLTDDGGTTWIASVLPDYIV